jgi:uncharacterized protein YjiS (DUF1127 family)
MRVTYSTGDLAESLPLASVIAGYFKWQWDALKTRRERARVTALLYAMDDRELKDLGFARSEIESVMVDDSGDRMRAYPKRARPHG